MGKFAFLWTLYEVCRTLSMKSNSPNTPHRKIIQMEWQNQCRHLDRIPVETDVIFRACNPNDISPTVFLRAQAAKAYVKNDYGSLKDRRCRGADPDLGNLRQVHQTSRLCTEVDAGVCVDQEGLLLGPQPAVWADVLVCHKPQFRDTTTL